MPTLSELRTIVRMDPLLNSTTVIADAALNTLLNEGAVQLARDGHAFILTSTWNTAVDTAEYVLSGASPKATAFLDVYWTTGGLTYTNASSVIKLAPNDFTVVSEDWLNREYVGWKALTASDTLQHVYFGVNSSGYYVLGTVPAASTTTPSFKLWYLSSGTAMDGDTKYPYTNSTTNLAHMEPFHKAIAYWALHVLHRDKTHQAVQADKFLQLYTLLASQCREAQERIMRAEIQGLRDAAKLTTAQSFGGL